MRMGFIFMKKQEGCRMPGAEGMFGRILCVMMALWSCVMAGAAEPAGLTVETGIYDSLTGRQVMFPMISVYRLSENGNDSTEVAIKPELSAEGYMAEFGMPRENGQYVLHFKGINERIVAVFDEATQQRVKVQGDFSPGEIYFEITDTSGKRMKLPRLDLTRASMHRQLGEVEVTASKVMFYHKGDTLVYNADAFVLAEGSMLDALLSQMPGVELKRNGIITVNGKKVDNLLLNGKDLFNGNGTLMLENLAAFTVKDIAVYTKTGARSELAGIDMGDNSYVMDVRLKREYSVGWGVNADAGYGTHERYLGKLFGRWFHERAALSLHFNANNLNDSSTPGSGNDASDGPPEHENERKLQKGGLTYFAAGNGDRWEVKGDVSAENLTVDRQEFSTVQNYFDSGDRYGYSWLGIRGKSWRIETRHEARLKISDKALIHVRPVFGYRNYRDRTSYVAGLFTSPIAGITKEAVENLSGDDDLSRALVNRNVRSGLHHGHSLSAGVDAVSDIVLGNRSNLLTVKASGTFSKEGADRFNRFDLNFGDASIPAETEYQYFNGRPCRGHGVTASAEYTRVVGRKIRLKLQYAFDDMHSLKTSYLYRLDAIAGDLPPFGVLPSASEYLGHLDAGQSKTTRYDMRRHSAIPALSLGSGKGARRLSLNVQIPVRFVSRDLNYNRPGLKPLAVTASDILPQVIADVAFSLSDRTNFSLNFNSTPQLQDMTAMVEVTDNTDPLNIISGNPDLRPARSNSFMAYMATSGKDYVTSNTVMFQGEILDDAVAYGAFYDPATGVRRTRSYNVDGNMNFRLHHTLSTLFGAYNRFRFSAATGLGYIRSVDLFASAASDADAVPAKRRINTGTVSERMKFGWQNGSLFLNAFADVQFNRYTGRDRGFTDFSSWICSYGADGVLNLPRNWSVSTDLTLYMRRGFSDSRLNTSDVVWNARVSKSVMKGALVFAVDGYDLLRQLSNVSYTINAQARTETVSNVIPSYVLFHIQYRFNKNPGKK